MESPFEVAQARKKKLKILVWGAEGVGKTTFALCFPKPVLFDLDGGADYYGENSQFDVLRTTDLARIKQAIDWLDEHPGSYETVVIDPITIYWELVQQWWQEVFLRRQQGNQNKKEYFILGPSEWDKIKRSYRRFLDRLIQLDANVVVTAREREKMARTSTGEYQQDGAKPDAERTTGYVFDVVLRLHRDFVATVEKDRTGKLPKEFETSFQEVEKLLQGE